DNPITNEVISKYLTVTQTQYFLLSQWVAGHVAAGPPVPPPTAAQLDRAALENCVGGAFCPGIEMTWICRNTSIYAEPFRIRMSANIVPGQLSQTNGANNDYANGLEPGDIIKYMAQPWQADFNECSIQSITGDPSSNSPGTGPNYWWWPAQRPFAVYTSVPLTSQVSWTRGFQTDPDNPTLQTPNLGDMQMVVNWKDLGVVTQQGTAFIESERNTAAITAYQPPKQTAKLPIGAGAPDVQTTAVEPMTAMEPRPRVRPSRS
ncbi:MAG TPA: LodA/GoxA family CTQ-dependent oxidase, partial [Thermoanaerobaculia bacterium]